MKYNGMTEQHYWESRIHNVIVKKIKMLWLTNPWTAEELEILSWVEGGGNFIFPTLSLHYMLRDMNR